jgi:hypothetical protein
MRRSVCRRNRRGNYSILAVVTIPLTFGFMALGLDISYLYMADIHAGHVADAASHAAFVAYRASGGNESIGLLAAEYIVDKNQVAFSPADIESITFGGWDPDDGSYSTALPWVNAAHVELSRAGDNRIPLFIAPILGYEGRDIYAEATTAGRTREIMVVQDITGSFIGDIGSARDANLDFLDYLIDNPFPFDRYGMSVFVGTPVDPVWLPSTVIHNNEGPLLAKVDSLGPCNCVGAPEGWCAAFGYGGDDMNPQMQGCWECTSESLGLEDDWWQADGASAWYVDYSLRGECASEDRTWGTNPGAGLTQGIDELIAVGSPASFQALVMITDGLPEGDDTETLYSEAEDAADFAWYSEGIHIWIVGYQNGAAGAEAWEWVRGLARGQGQGYLTPDAEDLDNIMIEIATSMPLTLVD